MNEYSRTVCSSMYPKTQLRTDWQIKMLDDTGTFAGYASVFDVVDNQSDVVLRGAFTDSLREQGEEVKLLWQHDQAEPIGVITTLREDTNGLYIEGRLLMDIARAREAYALLQSGVLKGLSIGYSPLRYRMDEANGVRYLSRVALWEVSLVTFPANDAARITVVKQGCQPLSAALDRAIESITL